jgi:hypothetical protein
VNLIGFLDVEALKRKLNIMLLDFLKNLFVQPIVALVGFLGCYVGIIFCVFQRDRRER